MQVIAEFFIDPMVWPAYIYLLAYSFVWAIAFVLARLFISQKGIERAVMQAWSFALSMHILGGTFLIIWICFRAKDRVAEWFQIPLYLVLYIIILKFGQYCKPMLPCQKAETYRLENSP